ncbi:hypothetical protein [Jeotgalibacillus proteolyticus]|nr:hypothetical protein [Jeotgalibacillus proteolyticus]
MNQIQKRAWEITITEKGITFNKREVNGAEDGDSCGMKQELEIHLR